MHGSKYSYHDVIKIAITIFSLIGGFIILNDFMDNKIDSKIKDKEYIQQLSHILRPFMIFNNESNIIYDHGAENFIDSLNVSANINELLKNPIVITLYPKIYLQHEPLIEILTSMSYTIESKRIKNKIWQYEIDVSSHILDINELLFRIEILQ